ncbi:thiol-activated cytolysin C-terminal domain-containing protein [Paludicola sp. MB14-C6]|uniref:thiol-activated cytolysin C-terminal domain-containing protein n=1 Tax=Paludihabitans sp. MB14-C6 TaxID=3070656 RepID=UPI0027DE688A|nr:thiol-activated cytolysin C-terminal domain-containing protein [Paludicola sp. MB14-C6]WMJ24088.1 thiol-activated cytolysin C-terminal domain-containing protein [Paludicola sp. MB14-C6]
MADLIKLIHNGCFIARFIATWEELDNETATNEQSTTKSYYSHSVENNFTHIISSNKKVINLCVSIETCTGLAWDMWKRACDARNLPTDICTTFTTSGTVMNPKVTVSPPTEHVSQHII